jgi:pimeloyl-ACP methyl ester carboxylesterase
VSGVQGKVNADELMPAQSSNFKTPEGEAKYIAAYETTLTLWVIPYEFLEVPTPWGRTHIIACGPKDAPPLVLLHGMSLSATMWFSNVAALSRNYRIYAVDTIGSAGKSVAVRPLKSRADLAGWLNGVLDGLGISQTHMLGHSHGGWLALNFALSASERVKRLILLAPAASLLPLVSQFWLRGIPVMLFSRRSFITNFMKWMTVEGFVVNELFVEQFVLGVKNFRPRPQIRVLPTVFTDDELRQIKAHTLLLIGGKEVIYDPEAAVKRAKQLIPHVEAEMVPNASHGLPMEQAELVNERILSFLNQEQLADSGT